MFSPIVPPAAQGATTIQRGVRYIWDRRATARRLRLEASVTLIQAAIRMFVTRQRYTRRLSERGRAFACFKVILRVGNGRLYRNGEKQWEFYENKRCKLRSACICAEPTPCSRTKAPSGSQEEILALKWWQIVPPNIPSFFSSAMKSNKSYKLRSFF